MSIVKTESLELAAQIAESVERVLSGEIDGCVFLPNSKDPNGVTIEIKSNRLEPTDTPQIVRPNWRSNL